MAESFTVKTTRGDAQRIASALRSAGTKDLRRELRKIVSEETKPTRRKIRQSALDHLPQKGGLNKWAARTPSVNTDFREKSAGVRIRMSRKGHDYVSLNKGRLRHPVFGDRKNWVTQDIDSGFFDTPIREDSDDLKQRIVAALTQFSWDLSRRAQ